MATYYVRKTGNDTTGTGATGTPWLTINKGISMLAAGDTLIVGDGTYVEGNDITTSGNAANWITIQSENLHGAVISPSSGTFACFRVYANFIAIRRFRLNPYQVGVGCETSVHHVTVADLRIVGGLMHGITAGTGEFYTFEGNNISGGRYDSFWSAISIYQARASAGDTTTTGYRIIVRNNIITDCYQTTALPSDGNGIIIDDFHNDQAGGTGITYPYKTLVEGNITVDCGSAGIQVFVSNFVTVRFNTAYLCDTTAEGTWAGTISHSTADNNQYYNNISVATSATNPSNTAYSNATTTAAGEGSCYGVDYYNNLSYDVNSPGSPSLQNEGGFSKVMIVGNGNIIADNPEFVDPDVDGTGDFSLQSTSPARDTGRVSWLVDPEDCRVSGSNTASTSWAVTLPEYEAGDLIVVFVASDANVTHNWAATGPDGGSTVTIVDSHGDSGTATVRVSAFYWIATATRDTTSTITVTPSATEQWIATAARIRAGCFNAGAPIDSSATSQTTGNSSTVTTPAWSVTNAGCAVLAWMGVDDDPITDVASGWTGIKSTDIGAVTGTLAVRTALTSAAESVAASTWTIAADSSACIGVAIRDCVARDIRPSTDLNGVSRLDGSTVDMGALEFASATTTSADGSASGTGSAAGDGVAVGGVLHPSTVLAAAGYQDSALTSPPALVTDLDDADPDAPDSLWWTPVLPGTQADVRLGFSTPGTLSGGQRFRVRVRPTSGAGTPTVTVSLYESGSLVRELLSDIPVTVEATLEAQWDTSELTDETGAGVEIRIVSEAG